MMRSFLKKNYKQFLVTALSISVLMLSVPFTAISYGAQLSDIQNHWAQKYIEDMASINVISGFPDGTFKPNQTVNRDQYIRMVVGAQELPLRTIARNEYWAIPYLEAALEAGFITTSHYGEISPDNYAIPISREEMASIVVKAYLSTNEKASQDATLKASTALSDLNTVSTIFIEDVIQAIAIGHMEGFPNGTFGPKELATRSQAAKVIHNHLVFNGIFIDETALAGDALRTAFSVNGIEIGDRDVDVVNKVGEPLRKDASPWGFQWWVYHENFQNYYMVGMQNNRVVGLYAASDVIQSTANVKFGHTKSMLNSALGNPVFSIKKGNNEYLRVNDQEMATYYYDGTYLTAHFDIHDGGKLIGLTLINGDTERAQNSLYGTTSEAVRTAYERQVFDLANVFRLNHGKPPFVWAADASITAAKHSKDMADRNFFDHINPSGLKPHERLIADGIRFSIAAENIAAGYFNAFDAHLAWVNSKGHRDNLLRDLTFLGVGVHFGGSYTTYYTQNMYSQ